MKHLRFLPLLACALIFGALSALPMTAEAGLKASVERLDSITGSADKSAVDVKLINALDILDKMPEEKKWNQAKKLIDIKEFTYSRYYDELLYLYMAHTINNNELKEADALWSKLRDIQTSVHIFPTLLIRYVSKKDNREGLRNALDYLKFSPDSTLIHGPVLDGNLLFGYKIREDFSEGELPKTVKVVEYKSSPTPLSGFSEENQYIGLLEAQNKLLGFDFQSTKELANLYAKGHDDYNASQKYFMLAESLNQGSQYAEAKEYIELASKYAPANTRITQLKNDIELALVLNPGQSSSVQPTSVQAPSTATETQKCSNDYLFDHDRSLSAGNVKGKSKKELRLMRNEIFARYGRSFKSEDLHAYFTGKCWYTINPEYSDQMLNQTDRANLLTIQSAEN